MKLSVVLPFGLSDPAAMLDIAATADRLGYETLWVAEG